MSQDTQNHSDDKVYEVPGTRHAGVGDVSASGCGGCISTTDRAHGVGSVAAPGTGHTARGVYQHHGQGPRRGECISTTDRAHGVGSVAAPGTGHTGLYPQARGTEPESSRMLTAAGVGHSCSTDIVSAAARGSGLAVCRAWTLAQSRGWRRPGCSSMCGSQARPIPPASLSH